MGQPKFEQARLKLQWAEQHIHQLSAVWQSFLKTDFCKVVVEKEAEGGDTLRVISSAALPAQIVLITGDVVHNIKCALDYTINEILGQTDTRLTFPFEESRDALIDTFRTEPVMVGQKLRKKGRNHSIEEALPGLGAFIVDEIRPYAGSDSPLWILNRLDNRDKHRLLVLAYTIQEITGICAVDNNYNKIINATSRVDQGGTVHILTTAASGLKITDKGKPTAEIFLYETGVMEPHPLFPVLVNFLKAAAKAIDGLDEFVSSLGWEPKLETA